MDFVSYFLMDINVVVMVDLKVGIVNLLIIVLERIVIIMEIV